MGYLKMRNYKILKFNLLYEELCPQQKEMLKNLGILLTDKHLHAPGRGKELTQTTEAGPQWYRSHEHWPAACTGAAAECILASELTA